MRHYDFAIVGGGPAGSSAARYLAKTGGSVVVFEREKMPRRKLCGGALSKQAISYLDFSLPSSIINQQVFGAKVHFRNNAISEKLNEPIAVLVTRAKFDQFLLLKALESGSQVLWQEVRSIKYDNRKVEISTSAGTFTADCALICEGANRKLSRIVREKDTPQQQGFCIEAEVKIKKDDSYSNLKGMIDLYFGLAGQGYG